MELVLAAVRMLSRSAFLSCLAVLVLSYGVRCAFVCSFGERVFATVSALTATITPRSHDYYY